MIEPKVDPFAVLAELYMASRDVMDDEFNAEDIAGSRHLRRLERALRNSRIYVDQLIEGA